MSHLTNTMRNLREADAVAAGTGAKMKEQTRRMEKMSNDMDHVHSSLDQTGAIIRSMGTSWTQSAMGYLGFGARGQPAAASKLEPGAVAIKEGWLAKRGPMSDYAWQRRWCVLYPTLLVYYTDEKRLDKKGEIDIKPVTRAIGFQKASAPGEAVKHRGERPFGFVLDADPDAGRERRLFYFDAASNDTLKGWLQAMESAVRAQRRAAVAAREADLDELKASADEPLVEINELLDGLHGRALDLGTEASKQAQLVKDITQKVDTADARLQSQTASMKKMM